MGASKRVERPDADSVPVLPGDENEKSAMDFSRRMNNHERVSGLAANSPLDDVAFGRHAPPDETAYKRSVS